MYLLARPAPERQCADRGQPGRWSLSEAVPCLVGEEEQSDHSPVRPAPARDQHERRRPRHHGRRQHAAARLDAVAQPPHDAQGEQVDREEHETRRRSARERERPHRGQRQPAREVRLGVQRQLDHPSLEEIGVRNRELVDELVGGRDGDHRLEERQRDGNREDRRLQRRGVPERPPPRAAQHEQAGHGQRQGGQDRHRPRGQHPGESGEHRGVDRHSEQRGVPEVSRSVRIRKAREPPEGPSRQAAGGLADGERGEKDEDRRRGGAAEAREHVARGGETPEVDEREHGRRREGGEHAEADAGAEAPSAILAHARGSLSEKTAPPPGRSSTATVPPWSCAMRATIARPSPDPFGLDE